MDDRPPLHIVLTFRWFDAFADGSKTEEWRRYGPRWNETTCVIGRRVILLRGYTSTRLQGRIRSFRVRSARGPAAELYGEGTPCAVFGIDLRR